MSITVAADGMDESRRFGHAFGQQRLAPLFVPDSCPKKLEVAGGCPSATRKVGRGERLRVGPCWDHFCLVPRDVKSDGCEARDEVAEERTDGLGIACKDAVVQKERGDVEEVRGGRQDLAASSEEGGVDCQREESGPPEDPPVEPRACSQSEKKGSCSRGLPMVRSLGKTPVELVERRSGGSTQLKAFLMSMRTMALLGSACTTPSVQRDVLTPT